MSIRRRSARSDARDRYTELMKTMVGYARDAGVSGCDEVLTLLEEGAPVVVHHGYEIDLTPPYSGPFCLEPDGSVTLVAAVYSDPAAPVRKIVNYQRPDGSLVREVNR